MRRRRWRCVAVATAAVWLCVATTTFVEATGATTGEDGGAGDDGSSSHEWMPVVGVRDVRSFNLLARNTSLGATLRSSCTSEAQRAFYSPYGCPNLGVIETDSIAIQNKSQQADMVVTVVATSGMPAAVMAYFDVASNFNLSATRCLSSSCKPLVQQLVKHEFSGAVSISASAFAAALAFQSLIEFKDENGDGVFEEEEDTLLSSYDFLSPSGSEQPLWGPINAFKAQDPDGSSRDVLNVTTQDGVFSIEYSVSDSDAVPSTAATKISVQVSNYPYVAKDGLSKLALLTYVGAARADASVSTVSGVRCSINSGGFTGWLGWVATASTDTGTDAAVRSSAWRPIGPVAEMGLLTSLASVAFLNDAGALKSVRLASFTFDTPSPRYVYWDPQLVFGGRAVVKPTHGGKPGSDGAGPLVTIVAVSACGTVVAFGIALAMLHRRKKAVGGQGGGVGDPADVVAARHTRRGFFIKSPSPAPAPLLAVAQAHTPYGAADDVASDDDSYITPLTGSGSIYLTADQAAGGSAIRAKEALVTCSTCRYLDEFGEGFCSNCGSDHHA